MQKKDWDTSFEKEDRTYFVPIKEIFKCLEQDKNIKTIADLGGGNGMYTKHLVEHGYSVDMYDFSEGALVRARERLKKTSARIYKLDLTIHSLPRSYDVIILNNVLAFIDDKTSILSMIRKYTKNTFLLSSVFLDKTDVPIDPHEKSIGIYTQEIMPLLESYFSTIEVAYEKTRTENSMVRFLICKV